MSAVVNAADLILQATIPRMVAVALDPGVVIPALKAVIVTAPSLTFQVDKTGTPSPASIVITATNRAISGAVAWSIVAGSATLTSVTTASPATATLLCANMTTPSVTIRATVVDSGVAGGLTYAADITIAKVTDGSRGARSGYGPTYSISSTSWSDVQANAVIYNELSGTSLTSLSSTTNNVTGDTVTLSNGTTFAQTKTWNGTAWASPGIVYDGNLLVTGTVGAGALAAGSVTAGAVAAGAITATNGAIANLTIANAQIQNLTLDNTKMTANTVTATAVSVTSGLSSSTLSVTAPDSSSVLVVLVGAEVFYVSTSGTEGGGGTVSYYPSKISITVDGTVVDNSSRGSGIYATGAAAGSHTVSVTRSDPTGSGATVLGNLNVVVLLLKR